MKSFFSNRWVKTYLILMFIFLSFSSSYSQEAEVKREIAEAIDNAKNGNFKQAIPVLEQYADANGFDDLKSLEIYVYLNYCYLATKNEALNVDRLNQLTDSYLTKYDVSESDGLQREDEIWVFFAASSINGGIGNNREMVAYLLFLKNNYEEVYLNREDGLFSEVLRLLTRGYYYLQDYISAIEIGLIASRLNADLGQENTSSSLEILDLLYLSYNRMNEPEKALEYLRKEVDIGKEFWREKHPKYLSRLSDLAIAYSNIGNFQFALATNQQVVDLRKEVLGQTHPDYLLSLNNLAFSYSDLGDYESALAVNQEVVALRKEVLGETHPDYLISLNNLAFSFSGLGDSKSALAINQKVVKLRKEVLGENHPDYLSSLSILASTYSKIGDFQSALTTNQQVVALRRDVQGENHPDYLTSLNNLANAFSNLGDYQLALEVNQEVLESRKVILGESHPHYLISLSNLASNYSDLGDYNSAITINKRLIELRKAVLGEKHPDYLSGLNNMVFYYSNSNDNKSALAISQHVVALQKELLGESHPDYLMSLGNLAFLYSELGDFHSALPIDQQVVTLRKDVLGANHPDFLTGLSNLASTYSELGDYQLALTINQQVLELTEVVLGKKHPDYLTSLSNLAFSYSALGDFRYALAIDQQVVALRKEVLGENHPDYLSSLNNLAFSYSALGDYKSSIDINQQAVDLRKEVLGESHPDYLTSLSNLASDYSALGDYNSALAINQQVVALRKDVLGESHPDYVTSLNNLAYDYFFLTDYQSALTINHQVVELIKQALGEIHPDYISSLSNLAISEFYLGKNDLALSHFVQSLNIRRERAIEYFGQLTESQRENYWGANRIYFRLMPMFVEKVNTEQNDFVGYAYDISLFTKGLLLNTSVDFEQLISEKGTPEAFAKFQELKLLKLQIQRLNEKPIAERYLNVDSLETVTQKLETELVKLSKEYGDYTQNLKMNWKDVQSNLGDKDVAIEFLEYPTLTDTVKYAALLLRKGWANPTFIPLFRKDQIEDFIKRAPNQIYSNGFVGKEIKKLIWNPLDEYISPDDRIYFSAAGILHQIVIENLSYDESTTLGDRYQMYRLSSTKELALQKPESKNQRVALFGGIKYDLELDQMIAESEKYKRNVTFYARRGIDQDTTSRKGWQFLPGTLAEAHEVSQILKESRYQVTEFIGETGSEESFKELSGKRTGIIHIATHGFFLPIEESRKNLFMQMRSGDMNENVGYVDPMLRSGLLFSGGNRAWQGDSIPDTIEDGILTAKEISHIDLRGTDLVVLSACETGLGDVSSEGVFGLQRAFKQAGAQTIIMSLWNVKDEATQHLMTNFYSYLMQGVSKRDAFNQARNKCREEYPDPSSWAAFIMLD
jgi:CHAT domain-containing protein